MIPTEIKLFVDYHTSTSTRFPLLPALESSSDFLPDIDDLRGSFTLSESNFDFNVPRRNSMACAEEFIRKISKDIDLNNIENLDLRNVKTNNESLQILFTAKGLPKLKTIDLRENGDITDEVVSSLSYGGLLENLTFVDLTECSQLTGGVLVRIFIAMEKINQVVQGFKIDGDGGENVTFSVLRDEGR